jgi:UDP-glucose:(heptosyl)LPS alpha-1,3-glucosyltransferase
VKLALVRQKYTPFGGAERFVERALGALREQGTDVTIVARQWQGEPGPGFLRCNPFFLGRTWRDAGFARCVQDIIASGRFDLVQSHERIPGCHIYRAGDGVHATWLDLRSRARAVFPLGFPSVTPWLTSPKGAGRHEVAVPSYARDGAKLHTFISPWHRYTLAAEAAMFRHPDLRAVICNSRMVRDDIATRFGTPDEKLHVIYNGVDLEHFHPRLRAEHRAATRAALGIDDATPVILFVGSGFERKGLPALLPALARMKRGDAVLLVVGRDRKERDMQALVVRLGIAGRVRFLGPQKDVRPFYGAADCFALPTLYDPMPNAALEALACGLPVVTSTDCGAAELIRPGTNGAVVASLDVAALARALDGTLDSRLDTEAVSATVAHLGLDAMAGRLTELYQRLAPAGHL